MLCALLPLSATAATSLQEQPPPWAARQDVQVATPLPTVTPTAAPAARTVRPGSSSSVESWYQARQSRVAQSSQSAQSADAVSTLQAKAEQGDAESQYALGLAYQGGRGVAADPQQAQQWLIKAANAGHDRAQYALALLLRAAGGDIQQSLQWQQKAAMSGNREAQYGFGLLYANGQYVQADANSARYWFRQAAERGDEAAKLALNNMPPPAIQPQPDPQPITARPAAVAQAPRSSAPVAPAPTVVSALTPEPEPEQFMPEQPAQEQAMPQLAETVPNEAPEAALDEAGISVEHNQSQVDVGNMSVEQITAAAYKGDMYAQLMLGALYEDGSEGMEQDLRQAASWYLKAARQGYPKAQHNLALLYEDGRGMAQDYAQAAIWYQKAADAGFSEAQNNLAVLYILGNGVEQDRQKAEALLQAAVAQGNTNANRNLQMLQEGGSG